MIVIVGAGLAGLVCAKELARRGVREFVLLEAENEPGGRVRSQRTAEGFLLDRGFQVLLDSYPAARRHLDIAALAPRYFESGALLHDGGETWTVAHPLRHPGDVLESAFGAMFPLADKARFVVLVAELLATPDNWLLAEASSSRDVSAAHYLFRRGFTGEIIERFFRPFFGGVFLDNKLGASAALLRYYLKKFATGRALVPALGMGEIPRQLAATLPPGTLRLGCRAHAIELLRDRADAVVMDSGERIPCEHLLLATEAPAAARLLERPRLAGPPPLGTTVVYFATEISLYERAMLVLPAGRAKLTRHFVQLTNVAPEYAPPGKHLVAATVLDRRGLDDRSLSGRVAAEITACFPAAGDRLTPVAVVDVRYGQRRQPAGFLRETPAPPLATHLDNVWLIGGQTSACSIQSTMVSGERAARFLVENVRR